MDEEEIPPYGLIETPSDLDRLLGNIARSRSPREMLAEIGRIRIVPNASIAPHLRASFARLGRVARMTHARLVALRLVSYSVMGQCSVVRLVDARSCLRSALVEWDRFLVYVGEHDRALLLLEFPNGGPGWRLDTRCGDASASPFWGDGNPSRLRPGA